MALERAIICSRACNAQAHLPRSRAFSSLPGPLDLASLRCPAALAPGFQLVAVTDWPAGAARHFLLNSPRTKL
eukprot:6992733-Pyramimonas_sp.AAC.1